MKEKINKRITEEQAESKGREFIAANSGFDSIVGQTQIDLTSMVDKSSQYYAVYHEMASLKTTGTTVIQHNLNIGAYTGVVKRTAMFPLTS